VDHLLCNICQEDAFSNSHSSIVVMTSSTSKVQILFYHMQQLIKLTQISKGHDNYSYSKALT